MKQNGGEAHIGGAIYRGEVVHQRLRPVQHKLRYRVFSLLLDVDRLEEITRHLRFFSLDGFNLFSVSQKQHGHRDGTTLSEFAWEQVRKCGVANHVTQIKVLCYPRILGFAFNPLTVYFCLDDNESPVLMIYEVRNTFGEDLTYILQAGDPTNGAYAHAINKEFYVSPFNNVDGDYSFHVTPPDASLTVGVALRTEDQPLLRTHFRGHRSRLTDSALLKMFFAYPLMTIKVVAGIHWEALKLWRKGLRLKDRPAPPPSRIVYG